MKGKRPNFKKAAMSGRENLPMPMMGRGPAMMAEAARTYDDARDRTRTPARKAPKSKRGAMPFTKTGAARRTM